MATHDYVIANASGAAVRADLNNALAAIVSNNSSATEPATTYPYMLWYHTTAGQLKMRNADDDGWVIVPVLDSSDRLLVGTTSAITNINTSFTDFAPRVQVVGGTANEGSLAIVRTATSPWLLFGAGASGTNITTDDAAGSISFTGYHTDKYYQAAQISCFIDGTPGSNDMPGRLVFSTTADGASSPTQRMTINSSGVVAIRSDSASDQQFCQLTIAGGGGSVVDGQKYARIAFNTQDVNVPSDYRQRAEIAAVAENDHGASNAGTGIAFYTVSTTEASPTERMRIESSGRVLLGTTSFGGSLSRGGFNIAPGESNGATQVYINRASTTAASTPFIFANAETAVGSISFTNTNTYFNDISDYRVKENVVNIADGITRVKQLAPKRFNFIVDPDTTVDGFLAHEVQDVVPHAVTGEKDAVDDEGKPQYQGIDQSKLVPLLTAALQEAIAKIETLEAKVAALEAA